MAAGASPLFVILGAAVGIGAATARMAPVRGWRTALIDLDPRVEAVAKDVAAVGVDAVPFIVDATDERAMADVAQRILERSGPARACLHAVAGRQAREPLSLAAIRSWRQEIEVNLTSAAIAAAAFHPQLARTRGSLIMIASQLGHVAVPGAAAYCASKGALLQLARALALEWLADGIRVNTVSPAGIETERLSWRFGSIEAARAAMLATHPMGRLGTAEEVAAAVLFLAEDGASYVNGTDLKVDGAYTAR